MKAMRLKSKKEIDLEKVNLKFALLSAGLMRLDGQLTKVIEYAQDVVKELAEVDEDDD